MEPQSHNWSGLAVPVEHYMLYSRDIKIPRALIYHHTLIC